MTIYLETWGRPAWKFIHLVAYFYPNNPSIDEKNDYLNFFRLIGKVLPCHICRDNFNKHLIKYPLNDAVLSSKDTILKWTIDIHNEVNRLNNKKIYTYVEAVNEIKNGFNDKIDTVSPNNSSVSPNNSKSVIKKNISKYKKLFYLLIFIVFCFGIYLLTKRKFIPKNISSETGNIFIKNR